MIDLVAREAPLPLVGGGGLIALVLACELGAAARRRGPAAPGEHGVADDGNILAAVLGLLGLLLAFTFNLALDRHETRRALVVAEANDLGTAYLRTALLDDPAALRQDLRAYAQARLSYGLAAAGPAQDAAAARADALQATVWRDATAALASLRTTPVSGLVLAPINEAFDTASKRKSALAARLPTAVVGTLALYSLIAAGMLGYTAAGAGRRSRVTSTLLFMLLTLAICLILDLDRARSGMIQVPQTPMADVIAAMRP
ncbi:hypothetical protein [Phenylobacterium sp.]|uniref:bestrophin-like domain n=1 Tax=Phenylobacterium sp. TaxID=1871053 RepID=UPI0012033B4E|nr:hypothetical protein [Phenylobacterium sp.]THD59747.1 MAG: hypothetical protein E8A49_15655 [Phenylobacterium sp.]